MSLSSIDRAADTELLSKKSLFDQYVRQQKNSLSAYSFVNVFLWKDFFTFKFEIIESNLCVFAQNEIGCFLYLPPLGNRTSPKAIEKCFALMQEINGGSGVSRIENVDKAQLPFFWTDQYSVYLKSQDYCYYRQNLTELKGNGLKDKRNLYNAFIKNHKYRFLPYKSEMEKACLDLYEAWAQDRRQSNAEEVFVQMLEDNRRVHTAALKYHTELGLTGRVVESDGKIKAYTFGYPLNEEMFCVLFEIADLEIKGLPAYIFREFCDDETVRPYKFINAMDDFAMPNLQRTKLSYQPLVLVPSYTVSLKSWKGK